MPMNRADLLGLTNDMLLPAFRQEKQKLDQIDRWYRWDHEDVTIPRKATAELRSLLQLAKTPWLGLVVTTVAQALYVDGYRTPEDRDDRAPWRLWAANDLDNRQIAVHRATLAYGQAYGTALPGVDDFGEPSVVMRGVSPRKMLAFYQDPAEDDWPMYAIRVDGNHLRVYDEETVYYLGIEDGKVKYLEDRVHDVGVCPVVRFANMLDLDGRADGEVEPFIPLAKRIDKTSYDRLLIQHFNSWKVRTVAGMTAPDGDEEANREKLRLRQDDMLIAEDPDTKFGTLPETPLDGMIRSYESDIKTLAAATQTPVNAMVGDLINLNESALAAARASLDAKVEERKRSLGKSHDQWLKLGSFIAGDIDSARDSMAHVTWADTSIQSMAVAADALVKFKELGVPQKALWAMIPNVSKSDREEWEQIAEEGDPIASLNETLQRQADEGLL